MTAAGDENSVRKRDAELRRERADLESVMATPQGRRVLWNILSRGGMFTQSFTGEATSTAFNEGRRSLALQLQSDMQSTNRGLTIQMFSEQWEEGNDGHGKLVNDDGDRHEG